MDAALPEDFVEEADLEDEAETVEPLDDDGLFGLRPSNGSERGVGAVYGLSAVASAGSVES